MTPDESSRTSDPDVVPERFKNYPLFEALLHRRSRRFSRGMTIEGGPTQYTSKHEPRPLSESEQALLAFAACGITGPALADWSYEPDSGGSFAQFTGRTISSADAVHTMALFVIDDEATWLMRRPQDLDPSELAEIVDLTQNEEFVRAWRKIRVKIADGRKAPPTDAPYNLSFNDWSLHAEGTTYFLPVSELTYNLINILPVFFSRENGLFVVDDRRMYRPAGLGPFAKSNGGHLEDDPSQGKTIPLSYLDPGNAQLCAIEQGMALQNLGLACQAMGLSGFPNYAGLHDYNPPGGQTWFEQLGFRMREMPLTDLMSIPFLPSTVMRFTGQNPSMAYPVGLERDGEVLLQPYCPPYYDSMEDAVRTLLGERFGDEGIYRGGRRGIYDERDAESGWQDPAEVTAGVSAYDERGVEAAVALCEYIWEQYDRFPCTYPPFHTMMGFQAGHVDEGFYEQYYRPGTLTETHRRHMQHWHGQEDQNSTT